MSHDSKPDSFAKLEKEVAICEENRSRWIQVEVSTIRELLNVAARVSGETAPERITAQQLADELVEVVTTPGVTMGTLRDALRDKIMEFRSQPVSESRPDAQPFTFAGLPVRLDPSVPVGQIRLEPAPAPAPSLRDRPPSLRDRLVALLGRSTGIVPVAYLLDAADHEDLGPMNLDELALKRADETAAAMERCGGDLTKL